MTYPPDGPMDEERWPTRDECEQADVPTFVTLEERTQQFAGGTQRALHADMIVRLYPDGTYVILKNRDSKARPFTRQSCVLYVTGEDSAPYPLTVDERED